MTQALTACRGREGTATMASTPVGGRSVLSEEQHATYLRDGVVKIPGFVGAELVERMTAAIDRWSDGPGSTGVFGMDRRVWGRDPEFRALMFESGLAALAADATDSNVVRAYFDQIFVKPPHSDDKYFHWHQDHPFWPIEGTQVASTWVALTAATVETSALEFVRGSHRWGRTFRPYFGEGVTAKQLNRSWDGFGDLVMSIPDEIEAFEAHPDRYDVVGFDVEPGDVLLFSYRVMHRSRGNASPKRRVAISYRWLGDDAVWDPVPGTDPVVSQEHTTAVPGSRIIDDETFPVAFERS